MENKRLIEKIKEIEMPDQMQARIVKNCCRVMEDKKMSKNTKNMLKRPMIAVASLALCLCVTGVTALAATGKLQGFFKDVTGWNGAVTGTVYEQATDEIELKLIDATDELTVAITMVNPQVAPYSSFETFGIHSYKIADMDGNVVVKGDGTQMSEVVDGKVNISISLDNVSGGEYKLIVSELVGGAKAEQPLVISGTWECEFSYKVQ